MDFEERTDKEVKREKGGVKRKEERVKQEKDIVTFQQRYYQNKKDVRETYIGIIVLTYFIVVLIVWSIIVLISPTYFHSGLRGLDRGKVFCASILISLLVVFVLVLSFSYLS
jgi:hypothetical protein